MSRARARATCALAGGVGGAGQGAIQSISAQVAHRRGAGGCGAAVIGLNGRRAIWACVMENVVLIVHLLLALGIIGVVLLQRSEGGGLGMGGGGGGGAAGASRPALSPLGKVTWALAIAFIITSLTLTILAAQRSAGTSVLDRLTTPPPASDTAPAAPSDADDLLPPPASDAPLTPPRAD